MGTEISQGWPGVGLYLNEDEISKHNDKGGNMQGYMRQHVRKNVISTSLEQIIFLQLKKLSAYYMTCWFIFYWVTNNVFCVLGLPM